MFVVVCISCTECNEQAVGLFTEKPTKEQIDEIKDCIGGMRCIVSHVYELSDGDIRTSPICS